VVIDVLRASSTIVTALDHGAAAVIPAGSVEEAFEIGGRHGRDRILYCGERGGLKIDGFDLGNSPGEYSGAIVQGKILVFASTNGSKTLLAAAGMADRILVGCFLNAGAAARLAAEERSDCLFACAGREGRFSLEDTVCAGLSVHRILRDHACTLTDEARSALLLYRHYAHGLVDMAAGSMHGRFLSGLGLAADIPVCASVDVTETVPVFSDGRIANPSMREP
jgi:2-phosphosulfolactate phosphatase